jgi:AraC-like DNA-binding protein
MIDNFVITEITRVVYVDKNEYPEKVTKFRAKELTANELIFHYSGKATVYFNGQVLQTSENTVRFLPKGENREYVVDREENGDRILICFNADREVGSIAETTFVKNEKVGALFKKLFLKWVQKDEQYYFECVSLLYKIFAEIKKTQYVSSALYEKIKPAIDYIHANFLSQERITAEKLSELCGVSYSYVKKLFMQKFKVSPKRYVISLKMNYACELIKYGEYSVSKIAETCGYTDIYAFSHQFKLEFGQSPSDFAKNYVSSK